MSVFLPNGDFKRIIHKSSAFVALASVFLISLFIQACGTSQDKAITPLQSLNTTTPTNTNGLDSDFDNLLCEATGDKDSDGDGICDEIDKIGPKDCSNDNDCNGNGENDGKEKCLIGGINLKDDTCKGILLAGGLILGWTTRGVLDGNTLPWKFNDQKDDHEPSVTSDSDKKSILISENIEMTFGNYVSGKSTVTTGKNGNGSIMKLDTHVKFDQPFKFSIKKNDQTIGQAEFGNEGRVCINSKFNVLESPLNPLTIFGMQLNPLTIQAYAEDNGVSQAVGRQFVSRKNFDDFCKSKADAVWIGFLGPQDKEEFKDKYFVAPLGFEAVGFQKTAENSKTKAAPAAKMLFQNTSGKNSIGFKFSDLEMKNISPALYEWTETLDDSCTDISCKMETLLKETKDLVFVAK